MKQDVVQAHVDIAQMCIRDGMTPAIIASDLERLEQYVRIIDDAQDAAKIYLEVAEEVRNVQK